ncbi:CRISPR-associated endonuclease Cas1 [Halomonas campisalis]|uniref:CRISPR-associated endonuclease Cas1 n=1 Tax=Billgrantia campisalis TaxID=74661 RepID=A0ABS9PCB2_9GAMM|nr:CRISPR-associated endonuclease Cas1 [Halomonas campisalis]MCG6659401.1 CRISPR-associated endonuclease Cas1 [Halomonas campisalis]MDR5864003.1 CRISPR-associated endonuclease Cas1 [Halomonas campisalis]
MSRHLYLDHANTQLALDGRSLTVKVPERPVAHVPLHLLERVTIVADIEVSTRLLHRLSSAGITITLLSPRSKSQATECLTPIHGNHGRRLQQYALVLDDARCLTWARLLVRWKVKAQRHQLLRFAARRGAEAGRCRRAERELALLQKQVSDADAQQLLGLEGSAARAYFGVFQRLVPASLGFSGRRKRPAPDPVNALLSLTYSMLTSECSRALQLAGLDPAYGVYHRVGYGRPSLACDLVELVRPQADHFVWRLVARQDLRAHHFTRQLGACLLKKEGRGIYFPCYEVRLAPCRRHIHRLARRLCQRWEQEG